ncbi:MAG: glycoside hydrolase family 92 protein, partial [Rikenellaceae bacterium]
MKTYNTFWALALASLAVSCAPTDQQTTTLDTDLTQWVDPHIGSGGHGHVFVGANVPHGMVQLGAMNISEGWDWCSGYHISDTTIIGFAHTHLSGTGIGDKGDLLFMPT